MCAKVIANHRWDVFETRCRGHLLPFAHVTSGVRAVMWECGKGQTDRHTDGRGHFASARPHAKCEKVRCDRRNWQRERTWESAQSGISRVPGRRRRWRSSAWWRRRLVSSAHLRTVAGTFRQLCRPTPAECRVFTSINSQRQTHRRQLLLSSGAAKSGLKLEARSKIKLMERRDRKDNWYTTDRCFWTLLAHISSTCCSSPRVKYCRVHT